MEIVNHMYMYITVYLHMMCTHRYIICKSMKGESSKVRDYMDAINKRMDKLSGILTDMDIMEVVPLSILKEDTQFYDYIFNSNEE